MSTRARIVFGVNDFLVGGMQKQFSEQIRHFDREVFDIMLITLFTFPGKENFYSALPADLPVHRLAFRGWWDVGEWLALYKLLRKLRPDIVVSSLFFANMVFRMLKPLCGYISVAREHNTYVNKSRVQQWVDRTLARLSYRIVAVSTTVADFTSRQEHISPHKFVVIHNGIDVEHIRAELGRRPSKEEIKKELRLSPDTRVLVNVARLTGQKNHKLLVEGFVHFWQRHKDYTLVVVGGGDLQEELEHYAREQGAGDSVVFVGHQSDTFTFYKMADAFVSTAEIEGLSNSYLKALASGLPLVSTNTAGTDELIEEGKNGFTIAGSGAQDVARALECLCQADYHALSQRAREVAQKFDLRTTVSNYEHLFTQALESAHE